MPREPLSCWEVLQHPGLQAWFQSSLQLQNPTRLFNFATSLLPKLVLVLGEGTPGHPKTRTGHLITHSRPTVSHLLRPY